MWNALIEDWIPVQKWGGSTELCNLPRVLMMLIQEEVQSFPRLREHQVQGWHTLLVQLAVLALDEAGKDLDDMTAPGWEEALGSLAGGLGPWELIREDLTEPALLQPPHPYESDINYSERPWDEENEQRGEVYIQTYSCPDEITSLHPNKAHSLKPSRIKEDHVVDWLYGLVCRQTLGYWAKAGATGNNYQVARVNGNYNGRCTAQIVPDIHWGDMFRANICQIQADPDQQLDPDKIRLVWLEPWTGLKCDILEAEDLSPLFVDAANRLRLTIQDGQIVGRGGPCQGARIKKTDDVPFDPWQHIREDGKPVNIGPSQGVRYDAIGPMIVEDEHESPACMVPLESVHDGDWFIDFRSLVYGQGKMEGEGSCHRTIHVPAPIARMMREDMDHLRTCYQDMVEDIETMRGGVLKMALSYAINPPVKEYGHIEVPKGGPAKKQMSKHYDRFRSDIDQVFFPHLWKVALGEITQEDWRLMLCDIGWDRVTEAIEASSACGIRYWWVKNRPKEIFQNSVQNQFGDLEPEGDLDWSTPESERKEAEAG